MHPEGVLELRQILENLALVNQERHDSFQVHRRLLEVCPELHPGLAVHDRINTLKILLVKEAHGDVFLCCWLVGSGYSLIIQDQSEQSTIIFRLQSWQQQQFQESFQLFRDWKPAPQTTKLPFQEFRRSKELNTELRLLLTEDSVCNITTTTWQN